MLVIRRVMRRDGDGETRMIAAVFARGKGLPFHHRYLVLVLMNALVHDIVDSRFGTKIAWFELIHRLSSCRPQGSVARGGFVR